MDKDLMINKKEFIKNNFYSLGGKVLNLFLSIGSMAILARLLTPNEFGIFAIMLGIQAFFQPILDMGLGPVYIKKENITDEFKNSFFTINIFLGIINILFLIGSIFILNNLYNIDFSLYIIVFIFGVLFSSLNLIMQFDFTREKKFRELFNINIFANIISIIGSIILAYFNFGIWGLIFKMVIFSFVSFILFIYYIGKFEYNLVKFDIIKNYSKDLKFGLSIFFYRLISGAFNSLDKLILGKFYNMNIIGNYNNAKQLNMMSDSVIRTSLTSVVYSYLERFDKKIKRKSYLKYYGGVFFISSIVPIILFLWGDKIVLILLGNQWIKASEYISILSIFSIGMILKGIITMISMHEEQMKYLNKYNIFISLFIITGIFILAYLNFDIKDILYFMGVIMLIGWSLFLLKLYKEIVNG